MTTEERLAKVERELGRAKRRSRWLLAALGLSLGALVWESAARTPRAEAQGAVGGRTVRANAFVLENAAGRERATLDLFGNGSSLNLLNAAGETRAVLAMTADKAVLGLIGPAGKGSAWLTADPDRPGLTVGDGKGNVIWSMTTTEERLAKMERELAKVERELAELREQVRKGAP